MNARPLLRPAALALAFGLAGLAPTAQALNFVLKDVGATKMSADQFAGFQAAADIWQGRLNDNVTIYLNIAFDDLGGNTLGNTVSDKVQLSYADVRDWLGADRSSALDATAYSHLQAGPSLSFIATQPFTAQAPNTLRTRLDNDTTGANANNNNFLLLTSANAKALGVDRSDFDQAGVADATITFSTAFANDFAYRRGGASGGNHLDFISVAEHEIGHALGFVSGVDGIDHCLDAPAQCGTQNGFDSSVWFNTLDLYRYSAPGVLNEAVGGQPYFSVDGGATALQAFSTGRFHGDGRQASHFIDGSLTLMRPIVPWNTSYDATPVDLAAMDAIGWNLAPVPEPGTYALMLGGLAAVGWRARRRRGS